MIKSFIITMITTYQIFFPIRGHCRFMPTCSEYAKIVIREHGVTHGGWLTILRLLSCQPFSKTNLITNN